MKTVGRMSQIRRAWSTLTGDVSIQSTVEHSKIQNVQLGQISIAMLLRRCKDVQPTNDTGNSSTDLSWLQGDSYVDEMRTAYGADMVAMLVESMGGCGRGYVMRTPGAGFADFAVQVTRRS